MITLHFIQAALFALGFTLLGASIGLMLESKNVAQRVLRAWRAGVQHGIMFERQSAALDIGFEEVE